MFSQWGKGGALPLSCTGESPRGKALTTASESGRALISALGSQIPWEGSVHYCAVRTSLGGSIAARDVSSLFPGWASAPCAPWVLLYPLVLLPAPLSPHEDPLRQKHNLLIHREGTHCRHSWCKESCLCRCNPGSFWCAVRTLSSFFLIEGIKWNSDNGTDKWKENCNHIIMSESTNSHEKPIKPHYADRCNRVLLASPLQWHAWQLRELYWQHTVKTVIMYS